MQKIPLSKDTSLEANWLNCCKRNMVENAVMLQCCTHTWQWKQHIRLKKERGLSEIRVLKGQLVILAALKAREATKSNADKETKRQAGVQSPTPGKALSSRELVEQIQNERLPMAERRKALQAYHKLNMGNMHKPGVSARVVHYTVEFYKDPVHSFAHALIVKQRMTELYDVMLKRGKLQTLIGQLRNNGIEIKEGDTSKEAILTSLRLAANKWMLLKSKDMVVSWFTWKAYQQAAEALSNAREELTIKHLYATGQDQSENISTRLITTLAAMLQDRQNKDTEKFQKALASHVLHMLQLCEDIYKVRREQPSGLPKEPLSVLQQTILQPLFRNFYHLALEKGASITQVIEMIQKIGTAGEEGRLKAAATLALEAAASSDEFNFTATEKLEIQRALEAYKRK